MTLQSTDSSLSALAYSKHQISKLSGRLWTDDLAVNLLWHWESLQRRKTQLFTSVLGWFVWSLSILFPHWWAIKAQCLGQYIVTASTNVIQSLLLDVETITGDKPDSKDMSRCLFCCVGGTRYKPSTWSKYRGQAMQFQLFLKMFCNILITTNWCEY